MSSEIATSGQERAERRRGSRRAWRVFTIQLLGPCTVFTALVWAVAEPYRIVFFESGAKGFYDYVLEPPLLVAVVGLLFAVLIAPGLAEDLEKEGHGPEA